jgi:hypothetical protein
MDAAHIIEHSTLIHSLSPSGVERGPQSTRKTFSNFIRKKMEDGELKTGDADTAATLFHDMLGGTLMHRTWLRIDKVPSEEEIAQLVRSSVQVFLHGYQI